MTPTLRPYQPMTELSPAAKAVLDAAHQARPLVMRIEAAEIAAAALRAVAVRINGADAIRQDVLDIAAELEGPG